MFKQLFKQEAEKPASTNLSEEGKDVLHERIGRLVKAPRPKPQETSHGSHVTEPTVLPREKLGLSSSTAKSLSH